MTSTFAAAVSERSARLDTRLCIGLDPRLEHYQNLTALRDHTLGVLEAAAPYAAALKPQLAFFEVLGLEGLALLAEVCALSRCLGLPIILDGKRGDIGSTAQAYAQAWLSGSHAGSALTVNPFLGFETLEPFVSTARAQGGAIFVLVQTSNPGQSDLQGEGISEKVAGEIARLGQEELGREEAQSGYASVGAVVGATHPQELRRWRERMPRALLLLPGLGAQGAQPQDLIGAFHPGGLGALASASRAIQYAAGLDLSASRAAAQHFRDDLNAALSKEGLLNA